MDEIIRPRQWTEDELQSAGFQYYPRRKQLVLAGRLPAEHAPLKIHYPLEDVIAEAGDVICFEPGDTLLKRLLDYEHWSVKLDIFRDTYRNWNELDWQPNASTRFLMAHGCKPYYKWKGAWAVQLTDPTWIQSLESPEPLEVPPGMWLLIGTSGEPWHNEDDDFRSRYIVEE